MIRPFRSSSTPIRPSRRCQHRLPDKGLAEPAAFASDLLRLLAGLSMVGRAFAPDRLWVDTDKPAGPALRDVMIPHCIERCLSPLFRCRQLFPSRSFKTTVAIVSRTNGVPMA